ncbi:unnamed protein product [Phaeothamnion confervicola]
MSFLDKAKEKASQLSAAAKEKIDDIKDNRKADDLLDDLGRITYRAHTDRKEDGDEAKVTELVAALQALEAEGTPVLGPKDAPAEDPAPPAFPPPSV